MLATRPRRAPSCSQPAHALAHAHAPTPALSISHLFSARLSISHLFSARLSSTRADALVLPVLVAGGLESSAAP
ncbi:hypothetical protein PMIN04_006238 [Paraphaeosphaeria minitans]